jgi:hypothetical protein
MPVKPEIADVHAFLRKYKALVVHFSGAPKGSGKGRGYFFPSDLRHVIEGNAMGGISCSVVIPGDVFSGPDANATGSIGVVVDLRTPASLVGADASDLGSFEDENGNRTILHEAELTVADLEDTLTGRGKGEYNEWVVRDFTVLGIFAASPFEVSKQQRITYHDETPDYLNRDDLHIISAPIDPHSLETTFPGQPIFAFHEGDIVRIDGHRRKVAHSDIYTG